MKASSVIALTRGHDDDLQLFWSQRRYEMTFLGGFWAFAGGSVDDGDDEIPIVGVPNVGPAPAFYGCAARETFEEMGIWVSDTGVRHVSEDPELAELRSRLHSSRDFAHALRSRGESVDATRLHAIGRWETPEWFDQRFDSEFFAIALTDAEDARFGAAIPDSLLAAELIRGEWTSPEDALDAWRRGERHTTLPIRRYLEALAQAQNVTDVMVRSADVPFHHESWLMMPGIRMLPLRSPTIPPATHTNCLIVGEDPFVVIDPGSPYDREQDGLATIVGQLVDEGRRLLAVVLTHHHPDHVGGVDDLVRRFGAPVWAHPRTAELVSFDVDRQLVHGDLIDLGDDSLECLHTPGHASGHLCFHHRASNAIFAGDLIASVGTILVNPPDGHMGDYLESLAQIRDLAPSALYPAHGWTITNPADRLQFYIDHRLAREEKVHQALVRFGKPATPADLVPDAYADAPPAVWPIAARSAEAHLVHLVELGRASRKGTRFTS